MKPVKRILFENTLQEPVYTAYNLLVDHMEQKLDIENSIFGFFDHRRYIGLVILRHLQRNDP